MRGLRTVLAKSMDDSRSSLRDRLIGPANSEFRRAALAAMAVGRQSGRGEWIARTGIDLDLFLTLGERNRIAPLVAHAVMEMDDALPSARARARAIHDRSAARMSVLMGELDAVAARLLQHGIRLVALKNAGIARGVFPCAACCPMGDLDVLVPRDRFREAHRLLLEGGYALASRAKVEPADLEAGFLSGGTEYHKRVLDEEVWLELQWRPVAGRWISPEQEPDGDELIARSLPVDRTSVRLLSEVDNLVQVSLHTAKHSYVRAPGLRLHTDVDRLVALRPPNWQDFLNTVDRLRVRTPVYFSLAIAEALLDTGIPQHVLDALRPVTWRRVGVEALVVKAGVFEPDEQKFSRIEMSLLHALLFDSPKDLVRSAFGVVPAEVSLRSLPRDVTRAVRRLLDLATRFQA